MAVSLSSVPRVLAHIARARDVAFGAYFLPPQSAAAGALLDAAHRGAHVAVTLQADPYRTRTARAATRASRASFVPPAPRFGCCRATPRRSI